MKITLLNQRFAFRVYLVLLSVCPSVVVDMEDSLRELCNACVQQVYKSKASTSISNSNQYDLMVSGVQESVHLYKSH